MSTDIQPNSSHAPTQTVTASRAANDQVTAQSTTEFFDAGTMVTAQVGTTSVQSSQGVGRNMYVADQSLIDFFSKPYILGSWVWTSQTFPTTIGSLNFPDAIFNASTALFMNRLSYYSGFRGDIVIRVTANPSMSSSGKMLFAWKPFKLVSDRYTGYDDSLVSYTQLPKVEFDMATDRTVTIKLPFRNPYAFWPIDLWYTSSSTDDISWGTLEAMPYTPLRGGSTVTFTVWGWFEPTSVKLCNPTASLAPVFKECAGDVAGLFSSLRGVASSAVASVNEIRHGDKPISSALKLVNSVSTTLDGIPIIGDFLKPVSWATALGAKVASTLGFSNPRAQVVPQVFVSLSGPDLSVTDSVNHVYSYSLTGAAALSGVAPGGLQTEDEMHFGHLVDLSVYNTTLAWTTSGAYGLALVDASPISPFAMGVVTTANYEHRAPFAAVSSFFNYWRGSMRVTVRASKSRFHTGRLLLAYDMMPTAASFTIAASEVLPRIVIDLESGNEWTYEFAFPAQWMYAYNDAAGTNARVGTAGVWSLFVLTPLREAGGAATTVDLVIECSMRPDASFMYPLCDESSYSYTPTVGATLPNDKTGPLKLTNVPFTEPLDPVDSESTCAGDFCRTFRTLIRRPYNYLWTYTAGVQALRVNYPMATLGAGTGSALHPTLWDISHWYALFRGSIRHTAALKAGRAFLTLGTPINLDAVVTTSVPIGVVQSISSVYVGYEVPQYGVSQWRYCSTTVPGTLSTFLPWQYSTLGVYDPTSGASTNINLLTAAADDFELSFFTGCTPIPVPPLLQARSLAIRPSVQLRPPPSSEQDLYEDYIEVIPASLPQRRSRDVTNTSRP